jgi:branched-chain amino acid transport system permease protein
LVWVSALIGLVLAINLTRYRVGRALDALRRDEEAAVSLGIDVRFYKIALLCISAAYGGVAGGLYVHLTQFIAPETFGVAISFSLVVAVILGGEASPFGAVIGSAIILFLPEIFAPLQTYELIVYGLLFIATMLFFPHGVVGGVGTLLARFSRRAEAPIPARRENGRVEDHVVTDVRASDSRLSAQATVGTSDPLLGPVAGDRRTDREIVLHVEGLTRLFGGLVAVNDVSFSVSRGQLKALIGPNGSGKTTTLNVISGFLPPTVGTIVFHEKTISGIRPDRIARLGIGRTFQGLRLLGDLTVLDNVLLGCHRILGTSIADNALLDGRLKRGEEQAQRLAWDSLAYLGLESRAYDRADSLSFGQRRQVELARALAMEPTLLLLDEPASGLNATEADRMADLLLRLRGRGIAVLLVEHNVGLVMEISDEIVVLDYGRLIAEGTPDEVRADRAVQTAYLGEELARA